MKLKTFTLGILTIICTSLLITACGILSPGQSANQAGIATQAVSTVTADQQKIADLQNQINALPKSDPQVPALVQKISELNTEVIAQKTNWAAATQKLQTNEVAIKGLQDTLGTTGTVASTVLPGYGSLIGLVTTIAGLGLAYYKSTQAANAKEAAQDLAVMHQTIAAMPSSATVAQIAAVKDITMGETAKGILASQAPALSSSSNSSPSQTTTV